MSVFLKATSAICRYRTLVEGEFFVAGDDALDEADHQEHREEVGAAVADEWERDAGNGHDAHVHAY